MLVVIYAWLPLSPSLKNKNKIYSGKSSYIFSKIVCLIFWGNDKIGSISGNGTFKDQAQKNKKNLP